MPVKKREDVHSPKNLVPKDYEYVTCFYSARKADEEGLNKKNAEILQNHMKKQAGNFPIIGMVEFALFVELLLPM
jgi:hypothetical protein